VVSEAEALILAIPGTGVHGVAYQSQGRASMGLIITLIIGGIVGWLASIVMKTNDQMGWIANLAVGVAGSMLGYWIAGLLGFAAMGGIARFIVAFGGAVLLIFILGKLGIFKKS
jgi:uncharacterized membrane protein YeaQ/YmgE (transglycosylase-associated protein family)